jgi:TolB protein
MNLDGADLKRLTYGGSYNISPSVSPDGKMLAYISRREGKFQLHVLDLITSQEQRLTDTSRDESPSFAPNSRYILFATEASGQGALSVVSIDGTAKYSLSAKASNIREPSWGPFSK